jgi:hypothetical protein
MKEQYIHINEYGNKFYYKDRAMTILHRLDGPAFEYADGGKLWYVDGQRHRLDGPAFEGAWGSKEWYVDGKSLTEEEFNKRLQPEMTIVIEGKKYKLVEL